MICEVCGLALYCHRSDSSIHCRPQFLQPLMILSRRNCCDCLIRLQKEVMDYTFTTPPQIKHNFFRVKVGFRKGCWRSTRIFSDKSPPPAIVKDPFFINSYNTAYKKLIFVANWQVGASVETSQTLLIGQLKRHPLRRLLLLADSRQMSCYRT